MKKIKLCFLILLVPLLLMGCIEKGVSTAVATPSPYVTIDTNLSENINLNISTLNDYYTNGALLSRDSLLNIINYLKTIKSAYLYGDMTATDVTNLNTNIQASKSIFFNSNSLLDYDGMAGTYTNIQIKIKELSTTGGASSNDLADLNNIQLQILKFINSLNSKYLTNKYYVELSESSVLDSWLTTSKTKDNSSLSYKGLLSKYNILVNTSLTDRYKRYITLIDSQLAILNNTDVIRGIDSLLSKTDNITNKYYINDVLTSAEKTEIKNQLTNLKLLYSDYKNNLDKISIAEYNFYQKEKEFLISITSANPYYYRVSVSGTTLNIKFIDNILTPSVTTEISTELERIYKLNNSNLSSTDKERIYIIYTNINNMKTRLSDYDTLNPNTIFSACIATAQLLQMLKDNELMIDTIVSANN